jgi:hypothetical protein
MKPSDASLIWQGLSPQEYELLSDDSKRFVDERAYAYQRVKTMRLVLDVLEEIRDDVAEGGRDFLRAVLSGRSMEGTDVVKHVVLDYTKNGGATPVREFYRRNYQGKTIKLLEDKISSSKGLSHDHRAAEIAIILAEWQDTTPDRIMKTEMDVIRKIMKIADENKNKGLTDREIALAAEELVQDEFHEAQFHLEALHENHREELLKRAIKLRRT